MKKNDWILILSLAAYSFLFYQQLSGINFMIFNIILIGMLVFKEPVVMRRKKWCMAATGSLISSICIVYYGNTLSVIANIISLSLLSGLSFNERTSVIVCLVSSFYSYFSSIVFIFLDRIEKKKNESDLWKKVAVKKWLLVAGPLLITTLFFFMYKASNPLFNNFAKGIRFDFISWDWVVFTGSGFLLLYGFLNHKKIKIVYDMDENTSSELNPSPHTDITLLGKWFSIEDENFSGKLLFVLLNVLVLMVNILDINFLFVNHRLPAGVTYSEFVHQGTGTLIVSIIVAIVIILFYFRGGLNFYHSGKVIKALAYCWILQNAVMLVSTMLRNNMYIDEYGLTYKRIGVYVYLLLTLIGLITTLIKVWKIKSNYYLFRANGWLFYLVLIIAALFNWELIITNYNMMCKGRIDGVYLSTLSNTNLPRLFLLQQDTTLMRNENRSTGIDKEIPVEEEMKIFNRNLGKRLYEFMSVYPQLDWRSWCYDRERIYDDLLALCADKKINILHLKEMDISTLKPLTNFNHLTELYVPVNNIASVEELLAFKELKRLDISNNPLFSIKKIVQLTNLEYLNLSGNHIYDYTPLYELKNLRELHVPASISHYQYNLLINRLPGVKIIKN